MIRDNSAHPGLILREYLGDITITEAATALDVSSETLTRLFAGKACINADMALRLALALGTSPVMWLAMQAGYDLWLASQRPRPTIKSLIRRI